MSDLFDPRAVRRCWWADPSSRQLRARPVGCNRSFCPACEQSHDLPTHIAVSLAAHVGGTVNIWAPAEGLLPRMQFDYSAPAHYLRLCTLEQQPTVLWARILAMRSGCTRKQAIKRAREATCSTCLVLLDEILTEVER